MRKKFLMIALALTMCFGASMSVSAAPAATTQNEVTYTTTATASELAVLRQLFNAKEYAEMYQDVVIVLGDDEETLWNHFVEYGLAEGRALCKDFNVFAYRAAYEDLQIVFGNDLVAYYMHYVNYGIKEQRTITTLEKATEADITVTGMNGEVIAAPAPKTEAADNKNQSGNTASVSNGSSDSGKSGEDQTPAKPSEPSKDPEPNPDPDPEPGTCTHERVRYEQMKGSYWHVPICETCGYVDYSKEEACGSTSAPHYNERAHFLICDKCFGGCGGDVHHMVRIENSTVDGALNHTMSCTGCNYQYTAPCTFEDGTCTVCGANCAHIWNKETGICNNCGMACKHNWNNGTCMNCGMVCKHGEYNYEQVNGEYHKRICEICGVVENVSHNMPENSSICQDCGYDNRL